MKTINLIALACFAGLFASQTMAATPAQLTKYKKAVADATVADQAEIASNLVNITPDNNDLVWNADKTKLLVVTWKSQSAYDKFYLPYTQTSGSEANVTWVTVAPRIQDFCRSFMLAHPRASKAQLDLRLKERLGLHPDWSYDVFVELWVNPEDIFRPCVDPSPNDGACELNFGSTAPVVKNIQDYPAFYKNVYYGSFRAAPGVPWTGLGYTYDWHNLAREQGESEFILSPGTPYEIKQALPTLEYCQP